MTLSTACSLLAAILCVGAIQAENVDISGNEGSYIPKLGENPWVVHLRIVLNNANLITCGGAIIDTSWIVTAARCVHDRASGLHGTFMWTRYGLKDVSRPELVLESNPFNNAVIHPSFNGIFDDICVIRTRLVEITANIKPIPYQKLTVNFPAGHPFKTCFWGLNSDRTAPSEELRCADMSSVGLLQHCAVPPFPFPNLICALGPANCDSDRGTPLIIEGVDGPILVGLLYYGPSQNCASVETDQPLASGFTRISLYSDWISSVIESPQYY